MNLYICEDKGLFPTAWTLQKVVFRGETGNLWKLWNRGPKKEVAYTYYV